MKKIEGSFGKSKRKRFLCELLIHGVLEEDKKKSCQNHFLLFISSCETHDILRRKTKKTPREKKISSNI